MHNTSHSVRFKGVVVGNFTAAEISERLRSGELSLVHAVRHHDRWMTLRQFLREHTVPPPPPAGSGLLGRLSNKAGVTGGTPPPPGADTVGDAIEGRVREGYLWCGLTFVLPLATGLPAWSIAKLLAAPNPTQVILLTLSTLAGVGLAGWRARRAVQGLEAEGLHDVGRSMNHLALALALAAAAFWITIILLWVAR